MQTVRAILMIFVGLLGVSLSIVCFLALLPLLWLVQYLVGACLAFGAFYIIAVGMIDLRRRWLYSSIVPISEHGSYHTRRSELLHIPHLALPAPQGTVIEEVDTELERSKILNERAKGRSLREIERELDIPYNRVQRICAAATNLVIEK